MAREGSRKKRCEVSDGDKHVQSRTYTKYEKWASACGVTAIELRQHLETAAALHRNKRGREGIPLCMGSAMATVRQHAELLCRVLALQKAVGTGASAEIGCIDFSYRAVRELNRIFALKKREVEKECKELRAELLGSESFDLTRTPTADAVGYLDSSVRGFDKKALD